MGQAAVDLPDPLDQQPPASPEGMDDLLSQLAGDEIDRLLAEADAEAPVAPQAERPLAHAAPPELDGAAELLDVEVAPIVRSRTSPLAKLNELADLPPEPPLDPDDPIGAPPIAISGEEAAALREDLPDYGDAGTESSVDAETQASLDALVNDLDPSYAVENEVATALKADGPASGDVGPSAAFANAETDGPASGGGLLAPGAVEKVLADEAAGLLGTAPTTALTSRAAPADGPSAAERGALPSAADRELTEAAVLREPPVSAATDGEPAAPVTSADIAAVLDDEGPLPLLLRPLEWLNAPLAACSPGARDVVGKLAIITTVNALAVLIYVAMFRR